MRPTSDLIHSGCNTHLLGFFLGSIWQSERVKKKGVRRDWPLTSMFRTFNKLVHKTSSVTRILWSILTSTTVVRGSPLAWLSWQFLQEFNNAPLFYKIIRIFLKANHLSVQGKTHDGLFALRSFLLLQGAWVRIRHLFLALLEVELLC